MSVTGIVLAGGRSTRFGGPKLDAQLDGRSLLARSIAALETLADEVLVAGPELPEALPQRPISVRLVQDEEPFGGPLPALAGALREADGALAIVVGGDMPGLVPDVLRLLVDRLGADGSIAAVVLEASDSATGAVHRQVLPLGLRVEAALPAATAAIAAGDRSMRALVDRLATAEVPASTWLALDPDGDTLLDVDTPFDLERLLGRE